jgi:hypothetical protein
VRTPYPPPYNFTFRIAAHEAAHALAAVVFEAKLYRVAIFPHRPDGGAYGRCTANYDTLSPETKAILFSAGSAALKLLGIDDRGAGLDTDKRLLNGIRSQLPPNFDPQQWAYDFCRARAKQLITIAAALDRQHELYDVDIYRLCPELRPRKYVTLSEIQSYLHGIPGGVIINRAPRTEVNARPEHKTNLVHF